MGEARRDHVAGMDFCRVNRLLQADVYSRSSGDGHPRLLPITIAIIVAVVLVIRVGVLIVVVRVCVRVSAILPVAGSEAAVCIVPLAISDLKIGPASRINDDAPIRVAPSGTLLANSVAMFLNKHDPIARIRRAELGFAVS
jgi:hypothetical protein